MVVRICNPGTLEEEGEEVGAQELQKSLSYIMNSRLACITRDTVSQKKKRLPREVNGYSQQEAAATVVTAH